ncbi:SUMF1/EgtB/PvdO family nonheme iron enzyme [Pedobacter sp. ASV1-7]|uniref:SUMF1/EgtB/PvdO family nonheme iron enzyme n=1 Tax=Pedobacter sp. ASV1-7 TaxID=3145237 RepID=UPI0032E92C99
MLNHLLKGYIILLLITFSIALNTTAFAQSKNVIGIEMVEIKAGKFLMGSAGFGENQDESPAHLVQISKQFKISSTEITNAQYELFDPKHKSFRGKNGFSKEDDEAVIYVSYNDAVKFCEWLSKRENKIYRLPTEAEWEYVCRAGTFSPYAIGDRVLPKDFLKNQEIAWEPKPVSLQVKQTQPNQWGVYDMHGNVEEWCLDWYGKYNAKEQIDPSGYENGLYRVSRGGNHNTPVKYLRSANRSALIPEDKTCFTGFRIVEVSQKINPENLLQNTAEMQIKSAKHRWVKVDNHPVFMEPLVYVKTEDVGKNDFLYHHNHCPAVTWTPNGDLLAIWFSTEEETGREMTIVSSRLNTKSKDWTAPSLFFKVPDRNMTGSSLFYDEQNNVIYHMNGVEAAGTWQNLAMVMRKSKDNGHTWTAPVFANAEHERGNQVIAGMFKTKEGWLIQPCDATPKVRGGSIIHISKDEGKSWYNPSESPEVTPDFKVGNTGGIIAGIHTGVVQLKNGNLFAFGRNDNIKKDNSFYMPISISTNMGKSWTYSASDFPPISSGQRLILKRLNEGALLLVSFTDATIDIKKGMTFKHQNGSNYTGYGMYAALSFDEGKTWPVRKLITDGKERYLNGGAFTGYFKMDQNNAEPKGYLALTQSPDNIIHLFSSAIHYRFNLKWLIQ